LRLTRNLGRNDFGDVIAIYDVKTGEKGIDSGRQVALKRRRWK
jgi:hypothetical protein